MKKLLSLALAIIMCVAVFASCGKSAYDIAVENGFEGTVQEWLESLKGTDGAQGERGDKGDKGDAGETGAAGAKGDKGAAGEAGPAGKDGVAGKDGKSPIVEIGKDGYWYIDGVKTLVKAGETDEDAQIVDFTIGAVALLPTGAEAAFPELTLTYTMKNGATGTAPVTKEMIIEGADAIDATLAGDYPVKVRFSGIEKETTVKVEGMMVYNEDFSTVPDGLKDADLLKFLGWKVLYKSSLPENADPDVSKVGSQSNPKLGETWRFETKDGAIRVINGNYDETGALTAAGGRYFVELLSEEYMDLATAYDYTIQYDMTFEAGSPTNKSWASMCARYWGGEVGSISGYASWRLSANGRGLHEAQHPDVLLRAGRQGPGGENIPSVDLDVSVNTGWMMARIPCLQSILLAVDPNIGTPNRVIAGYNSDCTALGTNIYDLIRGHKITIQFQIVNVESNYAYTPTATELGDTHYMEAPYDEGFKLGFGYHIWVVDEAGQRYLAGAYNPEAVYNGLAICGADMWANGWGKALAFCTNSLTIINLDNVKVWTGLGAMPADTTTTAYEELAKNYTPAE